MSGQRWQRGLEGLAQVLLFLLASLPFLIPSHITPITTFYNEWWAAVISLALVATACALGAREGRLPMPSILALPALFLAMIGLQALGGRLFFPQQGLLYAIYLLLAAAMMLAGRSLVELLGLPRLVVSLAAGYATGSLAQAAVAALQWQGQALSGITALLLPSYGIYGNLAQVNHFSHYLWLGLASLLLLRVAKRLGTASWLFASLALVAIVPHTGSRSVLLYPVVLCAFTYLSGRRGGDEAAVLRRGSLMVGILALAFAALPHDIAPAAGNNAEKPVDRLIQDVAGPPSTNIRLGLWRLGSAASLENPWLGGGVGAVPAQTFEHSERLPAAERIGVAEHYHNIFINWLAEFGWLATLAACGLLIGWGWQAWRATDSVYGWWLLAILIIGAVHSSLEYPLWHAYFLAPTALLLGAASTSRQVLRLTRLTVPALLLAGGLAVLMLANLRADHLGLVRILHIVPHGKEAERIWRAHIDELLRVHRESLFAPYVNGMLVVAMEADRNHLADKQKVCTAALRFSPTVSVVSKCAVVEALAGNRAKAERLLGLSRIAHGAYEDETVPYLRAQVERFPELGYLQKG